MLKWPPAASAKPAPPAPLVGIRLATSLRPEQGFVDDALEFDGAGGRLLWIETDGAVFSKLRIADVDQGFAEVSSIDLSAAAGQVAALQEVYLPARIDVLGDAYLVTWRSPTGATAALVDGAGKVVRRFAGTDVVVATVEGKDAVVVYQRSAGKGGGVTHTIEAVEPRTGKRIGKKATLVADATGRVAALDFRINHFLDGYTRIVGLKGGTWDRKEDQRSPDVEGHYDVLAGTFARKVPIANPIEHTQTMRLLAEHGNQARFLRVAGDLSGLLLVDGATQTPVELEDPFARYAHTSLVTQPRPDGAIYFTLAIDPTNAEAVARQKADPAYLDLYELAPGATKARRRGRLLADKKTFRWRATATHWAVLERHVGIDRGGKQVDVYALE
jgi:hypothetical protein